MDRQGNIDLRAVLATVWSRRWLLAAVTVFFTAAFTTAAFVMTPIYRATTVLVSAASDRGGAGSLGGALGQLGGLISLTGLDVGSGGAETEEALAVLSSREFTEAFIRDENLLPVLFEPRWDGEAQQWRGLEAEWPTFADGFKFFDGAIRTIVRDPQKGIISVEIEWRDPERAAYWANELVRRVNQEMRTRAITSTTASIGFLEKELLSTAIVETRAAIGRLMEAQINRRMLANVTEEYAFRIAGRALPPDPKDTVRPNKALMVLLGPAIGLTVGTLLVLILHGVSAPATRRV
jgi:uncharacterized protein involved in exopolysaccharide biosynthesis